jgi:hypothetical protein
MDGPQERRESHAFRKRRRKKHQEGVSCVHKKGRGF